MVALGSPVAENEPYRQLVNKANLPSYRYKLFIRLEAECSAGFWRRLFGE